MYLSIYSWEGWFELVDKEKKFLDWDFCKGENHIWVGKIHIVFNKKLT